MGTMGESCGFRWAAFVLSAATAATVSACYPARASAPSVTDSLSTWLSDVGGSAVTAVTSIFGADGSNVSSVALNGGGSFTATAPLEIDTVGSTWATWSGGYSGQVLYSNGADSITIDPSKIGALGFEVEPNPFAVYTVTMALSTGQSISDSVNGYAGARFFGYYGLGIQSVTISSSADFAIGDFIAPSFKAIQNSTVLSASASGANISAKFSTKNGLTLTQAATDLNVAYFDWQQHITYPTPYPSIFTSNGALPPSGTTDPPPGGWDYQKAHGNPNTYPFYYTPTAAQGNFLSLFNHINGNVLDFGDAPDDPCLPLGAGATSTQIAIHTQAINAYCGGKDANGPAEKFTTTLVGVDSNGNLVTLPFTDTINWETTFNGTTGGAFVQNTEYMADLVDRI